LQEFIPVTEESDVRIIKKYPNRRLYDTVQSRYVTLPEVRDLVINNTPFKVVDTQSDEDITRNILLQIILEQESDQDPLFSNAHLQDFIRYYSENSREGFSTFMEQSLNFFHEQQAMLQEQMKGLMDNSPVKAWNDAAEKNLEMWQSMQKDFMKAFGLTPDDKKK
jgi:polyhydroxyalkanoate synthesis repressor PhaR